MTKLVGCGLLVLGVLVLGVTGSDALGVGPPEGRVSITASTTAMSDTAPTEPRAIQNRR